MHGWHTDNLCYTASLRAGKKAGQLEAGELFKSPWTIGTVNAKEKFQKDAYRYSDISGFYYNASDKVKRHPIYTKEIGDPRWRTGKSWDGGKNHTVKSGDLTY